MKDLPFGAGYRSSPYKTCTAFKDPNSGDIVVYCYNTRGGTWTHTWARHGDSYVLTAIEETENK